MKLHLGCGQVYRPGYLNIDMYDGATADVLGDVSRLPIASGTAETIEAFQVLEHFDQVHCKYVLSEWSRVLRPGGTLVVEVPDILKSFAKMRRLKPKRQAMTLQWIYGIDSPGMRHRTGFTKEAMKRVLTETGFEQVRTEDPASHTYEPGMRLVCSKPLDSPYHEFLTLLRCRIRSNLGFDDSLILIPLEDHLEGAASLLGGDRDVNPQTVDQALSMLAVRNPAIAMAFAQEGGKSAMFHAVDLSTRMEVLELLMKEKLHMRLFSLWIKSRKEKDLERSFDGFVKRNQKLVQHFMLGNGVDERLDYILSLGPSEIGLLDLGLIMMEARKLFFQGVKKFHDGDLRDAMSHLIESSRVNPNNPFVYWNLGRLALRSGEGDGTALEYYERARQLDLDGETRIGIEREIAQVKGGTSSDIPDRPVVSGS